MTLTAGQDGFSPSLSGVLAKPWPFVDFVYDVAAGTGIDIPEIPGGNLICLHFSGLGLFGNELLSSADDLSERLRGGRLTLPDLISGTGYFTLVLLDRGELLFLTDFLGLEHLYIYDGPRGAIISNRLHATIAYLQAEKIERKLNVTYAAMALWSGHAFFRQCHAHELAVSGLSLVPVDCYLAVANGRVQTRRKPLLAEAFEGVSGSYDSLLDEAADQIMNSVAAIGDSGRFDLVYADLSGGRDSRIVFGALSRLGKIAATPIRTKDIPGSSDLKNALRIVEYYRAPIYAGDPSGPEISVEEPAYALRQWRSYYMGMYHKTSVAPWSIRGAGRSVRLSGGCGEIYRSFWSQWLSRALAEAKPHETIDVVFERLLPDYPQAHRRAAAAAFADCILSLPGETAVEKLDNHYLFFRNRTHFGMRAREIQVTGFSWAPLVSPALLLASRKLPWDQRRTGKVLFDVLDRLAPELNHFKYDGDPWPKEFLRASRWKGPRKLGTDFDREAIEGRWRDAQAATARASATRQRVTARPFTPAGIKPLARSETAEALERIISFSPELASILGPRFAEETLALFDRSDEKHWLLLMSKIVSLSDLVLD